MKQLWKVASFSPLLRWQMGSMTIVLVSESWQLVFIILLLDFNFSEIIVESETEAAGLWACLLQV